MDQGKQRRRVLVFIVAYNAETTIESVLDRIPPSILDYDHEVLIVDDQSADQTFDKASRYRERRPALNLRVLYNPENQGYGGNQKIGYEYAIREKFEVVVLLHGDGQYAPEVMEDLIAPILSGQADAVLGSRMAEPGRALQGGMPLYKYFGNRVLTFLQNRLLGTRLSEFHSGYRAYRVPALAELPFRFNTHGFHFDTEIIIQFLLRGFRIQEVPIPTYYGNEICRVNGLAYAWNVLAATVAVRLHQMQLRYRRQYDCMGPRLDYPLKLGYASSHTAALREVAPSTRVLDIGCGRGLLGKELEKKGCCVQGVDEPFFAGDCALANFRSVDLSSDDIPCAPDDFDYILLLDILEHLDAERQYHLLDNIRSRSFQKKPTLIITTPNIAFLPIRLLLLFGQFNYGKRGILDQTHRRLLTFRSLGEMLRQSGYRTGPMRGIPAPFPAALGNTWLARLLLAINRALIVVAKRLFSYQIFVTARPLHTVDQLLDLAEKKSQERRHGPPGPHVPETL